MRRWGVSADCAGKWRGNFSLAHDPKGKTLGILGMGGIGQAVARRAKPFGLKIQYHNRRRLAADKEEGAQYVTFERLLETSDILSLNLSLDASTRHIIGREQFAQMKDGVVIVNTARGRLMDEGALVDALRSGKVWTAGLDVFEEEPKIHAGLLENENVMLLPHIGTSTYETQVSAPRPWACRQADVHPARDGTARIGEPEVGDQGGEAADAGARAEGPGGHVMAWARGWHSTRLAEDA